MPVDESRTLGYELDKVSERRRLRSTREEDWGFGPVDRAETTGNEFDAHLVASD
jgi:hypothetical protein